MRNREKKKIDNIENEGEDRKFITNILRSGWEGNKIIKINIKTRDSILRYKYFRLCGYLKLSI